ncbi:hypothetical protein RE474_13285 [Methanolobus sediminis]|uniref:Uncharacterized protein n=1 Tax=Methanolobus sediminis TaxID=3072978 RepID=A0AA51UKE7_9EURY|nr:hypothetical protein [Methanolobus sediminis]WMW25035.1 hypothetical protein RE474_13285 [Methanolobus sediminis]
MISEPDQLITIVSSLLALVLFSISFLAYVRERRKKLLLLSAAFFFYAVMNFLDAGDIYYPRVGDYLEVWGSLLNFVVLALFFLALFTKEKIDDGS